MIKIKNLTTRDLTTYLRELILLEIIISIFFVISAFVSDGYFMVPAPIREFVVSYENGLDLEFNKLDLLWVGLLFIMIIVYVYSLTKLWKLKDIGRKLYLFLFIFEVLVTPFILKYNLVGPINMIIDSLYYGAAILIIVISYASNLSSSFK